MGKSTITNTYNYRKSRFSCWVDPPNKSPFSTANYVDIGGLGMFGPPRPTWEDRKISMFFGRFWWDPRDTFSW